MSEETHNYALLTVHPIDSSEITLGAAGELTACDIVGQIEYEPEYLNSLERKDGSGNKVGEKHFDLEEKINLTVEIPAGFTMPTKNSVAVIDVASGIGANFNGNWQIDKMPMTFENGKAAQVKLVLRRNEHVPLTP